MRRFLPAVVAALILTAAGVGVGWVLTDDGDGRDAPAGEAPFAVTALADLDTAVLTVPRAAFCGEVDERQVAAALGGEPADTAGYENGEEVTLSDQVTDVAHEFGCSWTHSEGAVARAWVFAPPVAAGQARRLVRQAGGTPGCESSPTPAFGTPSVGLVCTDESGARASYRGLFGDAWLTCELRVPAGTDPADLRSRADAWCAGVAMGASGTSSPT